MGVMYVIWSDHIYASYSEFRARDYKSSSCKTLASCSKTLRHRDHMHISLSRSGRPRHHQLVRRPGAGADPLVR